jgi:hypothetical protein
MNVRTLMKLFIAFLAIIVMVLAVIVLNPRAAAAAAPTTVQYIVIPHPDDEWQAWSQIENDPTTFKVFILMTNGEQSSYCANYGGKWSLTCETKRLDSWTGFFSQMSKSDPTIPGQLGAKYATRAFPANGVTICRDDATPCARSVRAAVVQNDAQNRGALVSFNLGDGDLTEPEVDWAIDTVLANKAEFGIPNLPVKNMVASFANTSDPCVKYTHPDHRNVHLALYYRTYPVPAQMGATCDTPNSGMHFTDQVSEKSMDAAWAAGSGAFHVNYGWLGGYALDRYAQTSSIFMGKQSFWVKTPGAVAAPAPVAKSTLTVATSDLSAAEAALKAAGLSYTK